MVVPVRDKTQFPASLRSLADQDSRKEAELVVVDYGSRRHNVLDELKSSKVVESGVFVSVRLLKPVPGPKSFNRSRALNIGFRWSLGEYVFTMDADLVLPSAYLSVLVRKAMRPEVCVRCVGIESRTKKPRQFCGSGIMLVSLAAVYSVGGYDESFVGYGEEDLDFHDRLKMAGCSVITMSSPSWVHLSHSNAERGQAQYCARIGGGVNPNKARRWKNKSCRIIYPNQPDEWGNEQGRTERIELK